MTELTESSLCRRVIDKLGEKWGAFAEVKSGSTWSSQAPSRFDILAIRKSWSKPCIRIYEAKSNRRTFLEDQKWPGYLDYCNEFYWLCPTGMIKKEEIDPRCGLITVNPSSGAIHTSKKAIFSPVEAELRADVLMYLFMWRMDTKDLGMTREQKIALIQKDMEEDKELGERYASYISKTLNEAASRYRDREYDISVRERDFKSFEEWCKEEGLRTWQVKEALKKDRIFKLLKQSHPMHLRRLLKTIIQDIKKIEPQVEGLLKILEEN